MVKTGRKGFKAASTTLYYQKSIYVNGSCFHDTVETVVQVGDQIIMSLEHC